jgi:hypothetical protein
MKIKALIKTLKALPPNMEVFINSGMVVEDGDEYADIALPVRKAKTKLIRYDRGCNLAQKRPRKDEKAKLCLIIE